MAHVYPLSGVQLSAAYPNADINMSQFAGGVAMIVTAPPTLAAPVVIKLQASPADPADPCLSAGTYSDLIVTDPCSGNPVPVQISIDPADLTLFSPTLGQTCKLNVPCAADFLRAVVTPPDPAISVLLTGQGRNTPV